MIDYKKMSLYAALFVVSMMLWQAWQNDVHRQVPLQQRAIPMTSTVSEAAPSTPDAGPILAGIQTQPAAGVVSAKPTASGKQVAIQTDVLNLTIDESNANVVGATLAQYANRFGEKNEPFILFNQNPSTFYEAQSGLMDAQSPTKSKQVDPVIYQSSASQYVMGNADTLDVTFKGVSASGVHVTKIFHFKRGQYDVGVEYRLNNATAGHWVGNIFNQLVREEPKSAKQGFLGISSFVGASYSEPTDKLYHKLSFDQMKKEQLNKTIESGWVAMQQHYFLSALIPQAGTTQQFYTYAGENKTYTIGLLSAAFSLKPHETASYHLSVYMGPEVMETLQAIAPGLDLTIDFGWLWFISKSIFWVMDKIENVVGNWGIAIILVTMLIKLLFFSLSAKQYRSMAHMREIQPKIDALRERFGDDKQQLGQATMQLYKEEKVNPMGGCLPVLVQAPFLFALYCVLLESVELRHAPFVFWIQDLSAPDPYYILAILLGLSFLWQQQLNPKPQDPTQAKVMMLMPIMFTVLFATFPAGLVLYMIVNNILSIGQQWYVYKQVGVSTR